LGAPRHAHCVHTTRGQRPLRLPDGLARRAPARPPRHRGHRVERPADAVHPCLPGLPGPQDPPLGRPTGQLRAAPPAPPCAPCPPAQSQGGGGWGGLGGVFLGGWLWRHGALVSPFPAGVGRPRGAGPPRLPRLSPLQASTTIVAFPPMARRKGRARRPATVY